MSAPFPLLIDDLLRFEKGGIRISNFSDWERVAKPKSRFHWEGGRSAMESARAWCGAKGIGVPPEIQSLLASHPALAGSVVRRGEPEAIIKFDRERGEARNADVALTGTDALGKGIAITIEAKADEPFGATFQATLAASVERKVSGERSNGIRRAEALACSLFPPRRAGRKIPPAERTPSIGRLRYQLFTAVAGTLAFAHQVKAKSAVFVIHEFVTDETKAQKHELNALDLNAFLFRLSDGLLASLPSGVLVGPIKVPANERWPSISGLYVGKAVRDLRTGCSLLTSYSPRGTVKHPGQ